ncbi:MAG TPA: dihydrolipoamide acetyltransferase family protein [Chlamydiales bacterium]|nr:dihydrolipoamide acetyltransferase family protein [Chlamydiales bacterium]
MRELIKIDLPKLGESIVSATVVQWFKKAGDAVALDEPLLEVATDKINSEIPSPSAGVLQEILAQPGQELRVGETLALLSVQAAQPVKPHPSDAVLTPVCPNNEMGHFLSPAVMRVLKEHRMDLNAIEQISRTGQGGRLTKKDVEEYIAQSNCVPAQADAQRVKMSSLRKAIADNMVRSFYEAPHASLITEVDVTHLVKLLQEQKSIFHQKYGAKLSVTAFVVRAMAKALQTFPLLNSSLDGDTIVMKRSVNLGIAVSVEQGVVVPVLRGAERLSLPEIAIQIAKLAENARANQLNLENVQNGTITMTNFGMTGTMIGVPIIRYPEVAIVGLGAIHRKVAAMSDDSIAIRSCMWVSLTFDHRVLDGVYGCGFLGELKKHLEDNIASELA